MTHEIEGIVLRTDHAARQIGSLRSAVRRPLRQELVFVPLTVALLDELVGNDPVEGANPFSMFRMMSNSLAELLSDLSTDGPVAYIETEYWGGAGEQAAAVWADRRLVFAPARAEIGPINSALQALGVVAGSHRDEFEAAGLHIHRLTDDWANEA